MAPRKLKSFQFDTAETEPIEFELGGETFTAYGETPGAVLLDFAARSGGDSIQDTATAILGYLKSSMDSENWERFDKLIRDPAKNVPTSVLSDVVSFLIEERTSRPSKAS